MQSIIVSTIGISPIINSITTLSTSIFNLLGHIKLSKNIHYGEIMTVLARTDIEATIMLLQQIIQDVSGLSHKTYFVNNKFILIALQHVKEIIASIEMELHIIKSHLTYNASLYMLPSLRSYDLLPHLINIESKSAVLDRRCEYLFKSLDLCKHFTEQEWLIL